MTDEERKTVEEVGELIIDLVQGIAERFGKVGVRALVVSEDLGRTLGVTPEKQAAVMTPCGPVRITVEQSSTAFAEQLVASQPHFHAPRTTTIGVTVKRAVPVGGTARADTEHCACGATRTIWIYASSDDFVREVPGFWYKSGG